MSQIRKSLTPNEKQRENNLSKVKKPEIYPTYSNSTPQKLVKSKADGFVAELFFPARELFLYSNGRETSIYNPFYRGLNGSIRVR